MLNFAPSQVILKNYVTDSPKESDMSVSSNGTINLKALEGTNGVVAKKDRKSVV